MFNGAIGKGPRCQSLFDGSYCNSPADYPPDLEEQFARQYRDWAHAPSDWRDATGIGPLGNQTLYAVAAGGVLGQRGPLYVYVLHCHCR